MAHRSIHFEEGAVLSQNDREINRQMIKSLTGQNVVALSELDFNISDNKLIITSGTINVVGGSIELTDEIFEFNMAEVGVPQYAIITLDTSLVNEPIIEQVSDSRGDTFEIHSGILTDNVVSFSTTTTLPTENDNINNELGSSSFVLFECVVSNALTLNVVREPAKISAGKRYTDISDLGILYPYSISDIAIQLPEGETLISYNNSDDFLANNLPLIFYEENLNFVISFTKLQGKLIITLKSDELESLTFETIYQSALWNKYLWKHYAGTRTINTNTFSEGNPISASLKHWKRLKVFRGGSVGTLLERDVDYNAFSGNSSFESSNFGGSTAYSQIVISETGTNSWVVQDCYNHFLPFSGGATSTGRQATNLSTIIGEVYDERP